MATEIYSIEDLDDIRLDLSGHYELMVDLDFDDDNSYDDPGNKNDFITGTGWIPLGDNVTVFSGGFNGNFNDITNLYTTLNNNNVGLFGHVNTDNEIKNVRVIDFYISVADFYSNAGGLCGVVYGNGSVYNCFTSGTIEGRVTGVGGVIGFCNIVIDNCYSHANVTGNSNVGGLIGDVRGGSKYVSNCYSTGTVSRFSTSTDTSFGGFAGRNWQSRVRNCYSTGEVIYLEETNPTDKGFCGVVSTSGNFEDTDNFWDMNTSNQTSSAGNATGKTTVEMKDIDTFTDDSTFGLDSPWDMVLKENHHGYIQTAVWFIDDGVDYPGLFFELDSQPISSMSGVYVEVGEENTFVYGNIPNSVINKIYLELDFNGTVYNTEEHNELFEYWNGSVWQEYPTAGLEDYFGNQFRFTTSTVSSGFVRNIRGYSK